MVRVVSNVQTMYKPIKSEKLSPAEQVEVLIEEVESDIFMAVGDNPLLEVLNSPKVLHLQKRLDLLQKKKVNITRMKKDRKRHNPTDPNSDAWVE
jgi:hypothetical protein